MSSPEPLPPSRRYGRYVGLLAFVILVLITINTALTKPNGVRGVQPGQPIPPFAAPLVTGRVKGDVNVATRPNEGSAGRRPACEVRGQGILNVCELYERRPLVLVLFVNAGSCPQVLGEMQTLSGEFPQVAFAGVALRGDRGEVGKLVASKGLSRVPVGFDEDGVLLSLYKMASCPQISFVLPGGLVQSPALLSRPSLGELRVRVAELQAAATRARGQRRSST